MKPLAFLLPVLALSLQSAQPARPIEDAIERLATCQDSWRDWKDDPVQTKKFTELFRGTFDHEGEGGSFTSSAKLSVLGLPVLRVYPESVGMGVGFSVVLDATFDTARAHTERAVGRKLGGCESGEGMRTCELEIAKERTVTLLSGEHDEHHETLLGCYYLYVK
jgi:hypothetical protein